MLDINAEAINDLIKEIKTLEARKNKRMAKGPEFLHQLKAYREQH